MQFECFNLEICSGYFSLLMYCTTFVLVLLRTVTEENYLVIAFAPRVQYFYINQVTVNLNVTLKYKFKLI